MEKKIVFGEDVRSAVKETVTTLARAVKGTLGPLGTNVGTLSAIFNPIIVNDGVTVAKDLKFEDPLKEYLSKVLKRAAEEVELLAGDGTSTTTTFLEAILVEGLNAIEEGHAAVNLVKGMEIATTEALKLLEGRTIPLKNNKTLLTQVATISANNDKVLGELVANTLQTIGVDGQISLENSGSRETYAKIFEGVTYEAGFESPLFVNTPNRTVVYEDVKVLVVEGRLDKVSSILPLLEGLHEDKTPIVIFADEFSPEALSDLTNNKTKHGLKVCIVRTPGYGQEKDDNISDLALISNTDITEVRDIDKVKKETLGSFDKITITENTVTINFSKERAEAVEARIQKLKAEAETKEGIVEKYDRENLAKRVARLSEGIVIIYVGGDSAIDATEKLYRLEDTVGATRAALQEGVVVGGGITFLEISETMQTQPSMSLLKTEQEGYDIVVSALEAPFRTLCVNSGKSYSSVYSELAEARRKTPPQRGSKENFGYNAKTDKYENLLEAGILDSKKVARNALQQASVLAQMVLKMDCIIY